MTPKLFSATRWHALMAGALLMLTATASAQTQTDPRTDAKAHLGPVYVTPGFAVKEFGVDTNVFNSPTARQDFTTTLTPRATLWVPIARRALVTTFISTDFVYYATYATERSVDPELRIRGDLFLNRITLFAAPAHRRTRERLNYEVDARAGRQEDSLEAGASIRLSQSVSIDIGGRHSVIDFDDDEFFRGTSLQETLNRDSRVASATLRSELTPLTTLLLRAERVVDHFELSPLRDSSSVAVLPGIEFKPAALVSGTASVGYRSFAPKSASLASFSGVVARAGLDYVLGDSTRFFFTADRDVTYSFEVARPYYVLNGYGLQVARRLVGRSDITVAAHRNRYAYRDFGRPAVGASKIDTLQTLSASLGYRVGRLSRVGFGFSHYRRHSNSVLERDYEGLRVGATADYGF